MQIACAVFRRDLRPYFLPKFPIGRAFPPKPFLPSTGSLFFSMPIPTYSSPTFSSLSSASTSSSIPHLFSKPSLPLNSMETNRLIPVFTAFQFYFRVVSC